MTDQAGTDRQVEQTNHSRWEKGFPGRLSVVQLVHLG